MVNMNHFEEPCVYALHAGDHVYRYVGSTRINALNRLWQHRYRARSGHNAAVYRWIREVGIDSVVIEPLYFENDTELREALEVATIVKLIGEGFPLTNNLWTRYGGKLARSLEAQAEYRARKGHKPRPAKEPKPAEPPKVKAPRVPKHGTRTEYELHKCKCAECRYAGAVRNALRRGKPVPAAVTVRRTPEENAATVAAFRARTVPVTDFLTQHGISRTHLYRLINQ